MLNSKIIKLFNCLSSITNTIVVNYPLTIGKSEDGSMCFLIDISEFNQDKFTEKLHFNNNFDKFLSIFTLFNDYKVSLNNDVLTVSSLDNKIKSDFILSDPALMASYDVAPDLFNRIKDVPDVCSFELSSDNIKNIRSACGIFSDLGDIIYDVNENINISLGNYSKFNTRSNCYNITLKGEIKKEFCIRMPVNSIKSIPVCNYDVNIKYSSNKNVYRVVLKAKEFKNLQIILSCLV